MPDTLSSDRVSRQYRRAGRVGRALQRLFGSASPNAANQRRMRLEHEFFSMCGIFRLQGRHETLIGYQARLLDLLDEGTGAVPTIRTAVHAEGMAGRLQDEASELTLLRFASDDPIELNELERRTRSQIGELYRLLVAIRRRKAVIP